MMVQEYVLSHVQAPKKSFDLMAKICGHPRDFSLEHQTLNWGLLYGALIYWVFAFENFILGIPIIGVLVVFGVLCFGMYVIMRSGKSSVNLIATIAISLQLFTNTLSWFGTGGINGPTVLFYLSIIMVAFTVLHGWVRTTISLITVLHLVAMAVIQYISPESITPYASETVRYFDTIFSAMLEFAFLLGYVGIMLHNYNQRRRQTDDLLLNILPEPVADKLRYTPSETIAENYDSVSILFADVVDFTPMSSTMSPTEVVNLLNDIFSHFDTLVDKYGLEKIKTIGDCYMVAAGVPTFRSDHAQVITRLALEMQDYVLKNQVRGRQLSFRIGINSGSVTAGVIGRRKFIYDLWGDSVNTASRMESHGLADCIQITEETYHLIKSDFHCEPRGPIHVKGKGEMQVWHVMRYKK